MMGQRDFMFRQEASKPQAVRATLGRFWRYFRAYRHVLLVVALLVVVSTYLQVTIPDLIGQTVDCYLTPATQAAFARSSGVPGAAATAGPAASAATNCWYTTVNPQATTADYLAGLGGLLLLRAQHLVGATMSLGLIVAFIAYTQRFNQRAMR